MFVERIKTIGSTHLLKMWYSLLFQAGHARTLGLESKYFEDGAEEKSH
jgi:hypothetical protein